MRTARTAERLRRCTFLRKKSGKMKSIAQNPTEFYHPNKILYNILFASLTTIDGNYIRAINSDNTIR
jgi:hypothetical protein